MSHTKGIWHATKAKHGIDPDDHVIAVINPDDDDRSILIHSSGEAGEPFSDAERIAACVNLCTDPNGRPLSLEDINSMIDEQMTVVLTSEFEAMLSALKGLLSLHEPQGRFQPSHYKPFLFKACDAIAKVDPGYKPAKAYEEAQDLVEQRSQLLDSLKQIISACDECDKDDNKSIADTFTKEIEDSARAIVAKIGGAV